MHIPKYILNYLGAALLRRICLLARSAPSFEHYNASVLSASERLVQERVKKYKTGAAELKDLLQQVLHHPDFNPDDVDHGLHCSWRCRGMPISECLSQFWDLILPEVCWCTLVYTIPYMILQDISQDIPWYIPWYIPYTMVYTMSP
jgi:hypothetical protein